MRAGWRAKNKIDMIGLDQLGDCAGVTLSSVEKKFILTTQVVGCLVSNYHSREPLLFT